MEIRQARASALAYWLPMTPLLSGLELYLEQYCLLHSLVKFIPPQWRHIRQPRQVAGRHRAAEHPSPLGQPCSAPTAPSGPSPEVGRTSHSGAPRRQRGTPAAKPRASAPDRLSYQRGNQVAAVQRMDLGADLVRPCALQTVASFQSVLPVGLRD